MCEPVKLTQIGTKKGAAMTRACLSVLFISLHHFPYFTFRIIMSFRKLIPPFTLTDSTVLYYTSFAKLGHGGKIVQSKLKSAFNILILTENNSSFFF